MPIALSDHSMTLPLVLVWGTGSIGRRHLQVLDEAKLAQPLALPVRPNPAPDLSFATTVPDLRTAVNRGATTVIIATNTSRHVDDTEAALLCGCAVLVEKPLAMDAEQGSRLFRVVEHGEDRVRVGYNLRFVPSLFAFRAHLHRIGPVHHVSVACQSFLPDWRPAADYRVSYSARASEGGVLLDLSHEIDYARWVFGEPHRVSASLTNSGVLGIESEEAADITWVMPDDSTITFRLDYLTREPRRCMRAFGRDGEITWDAIRDEVTLRLHGQPERRIEVGKVERNTVFAAQARAFLAGPDGSEWDRLASLEDGLRVLVLCDAARRASRSGATQVVPPLQETSAI